jgi:nicotinate-nucleotide pyrophosphorylase (carboxylating)
MNNVAALKPSDYEDLVRRALDEDIGVGDVTTEATVAPDARGHGVLVAKSRLVVAGLEVAFAVFKAVAAERPLAIDALVHDGDRVESGTVLAVVNGPAAALLTAERTALNLLQRLCGIATATRAAVDATAGRIAVLDTRKTTPTLRALEKYAVRVGGGRNHRFGLYDLVLIKDNHVRLAGGVTNAVDAARRRSPGVPIEIEAQTVAQAAEAADAGADIVLLDNLSTPQIRAAVERIAGRAKTEISGNVTMARLPELSTTGADFVSMGALTHSVQAADISFEIEPLGAAQ